jgi:hypothetical protein
VKKNKDIIPFQASCLFLDQGKTITHSNSSFHLPTTNPSFIKERANREIKLNPHFLKLKESLKDLRGKSYHERMKIQERLVKRRRCSTISQVPRCSWRMRRMKPWSMIHHQLKNPWGRRFAKDWRRGREKEGDGLERRESKIFLSTLERESKGKMDNFGANSK